MSKNQKKTTKKAAFIRVGDVLVIGGVEYEVAANQPGYTGMAKRSIALYPTSDKPVEFVDNVTMIVPSHHKFKVTRPIKN